MSLHSKSATKAATFSIVSNLLLAIAKGTVGVLGSSQALIADAIESFTDIFASTLVYFGLKISALPPDKNHPYGHGKAEALITFIVVGFLVVSASYIIIDSIKHLQLVHTPPKAFTLYFLAAIILIKEFSYQYIKRKSIQTNSTLLMADAWHHRSDAITSIIAFAGISISITMGGKFEKADDIAAIIAGIVILYNAYKIFRPALGEVMDEDIYLELQKRVRKIAATNSAIISTEKCNIRKSGMLYYIDLHIIVNGEISVQKGHYISHQVKDKIMLEIKEIADVLIHVEPDRFE